MKTKIIFIGVLLSVLSFFSCMKGNGDINEKLLQAVMENDTKTVSKCLKKGGDPNTLLEDGQSSVLHMAIYKKNFDMFKILVDAGADINKEDSERFAPLTLAAARNLVDFVNYLIEKGADVNYINHNFYKGTALMEAANTNSVECMKILMDNGAELDTKDLFGYPAISFAADKECYEAVVLLAEAGADINLYANDKIGPLDRAIRSGNEKIIQYLESIGAESFNDKPVQK